MSNPTFLALQQIFNRGFDPAHNSLRVGRQGALDENMVSELQPVISYLPWRVSSIRDIVQKSGSAVVSTNNQFEFRLATSASSGDKAILETAQLGRYEPGALGLPGIAVRTSGDPSSGQDIRWGYFATQSNGIGFGKDADGLFVFRTKDGTENKTIQNSWNADKLDGNGPSGMTLDTADGHIYNLPFTYYGYGTIEWQVVVPESQFTSPNRDQHQRIITVHREKVDGETSFDNPHLPITATIQNSTSDASSLECFVGGRKYAVVGGRADVSRNVGETNFSRGSIGTSYVPLVSIQRKDPEFTGVDLKFDAVEIIADADAVFQIRLDPSSLGGKSFRAPTDVSTTETAVTVDTSATAIAGGEKLFEANLASASGGKTEDVGQRVTVPIPRDKIGTLCIRKVSGTGMTATATLRWREGW